MTLFKCLVSVLLLSVTDLSSKPGNVVMVMFVERVFVIQYWQIRL